jgi:hypothetical protein
LYGIGKRSQDWFNHLLHQRIPRSKRIEIWENTLNHDCGNHSKCHCPANQGYQWKKQNKTCLKLVRVCEGISPNDP